MCFRHGIIVTFLCRDSKDLLESLDLMENKDLKYFTLKMNHYSIYQFYDQAILGFRDDTFMHIVCINETLITSFLSLSDPCRVVQV